MIGSFHFWDVMKGYAEIYVLWLSRVFFLLLRIVIGNEFVDMVFFELPW